MFLNNRTVICVLFVNIWLCLTNVAARLKYSVSDWRMCDTGDEGFLTIRNIPLQKCMLECDLRSRCSAMKYLIARRECRLLENDENMSRMYNSRPCIFIRKVDIDDITLNNGSLQNCSAKEVRNDHRESCDVQECDKLSVNNTYILGNMQSVGAKVKVLPLPGYTLGAYSGKSTCQTNGEWDLVPEATRVGCGDPPIIENAVLKMENKEHSYRNYSCKTGYEVADQNADMSVICLNNGKWSTIGFHCEVRCEGGWFRINQSCYMVIPHSSVRYNCASVSCLAVKVFIRGPSYETSYDKYCHGRHIPFWIGMTYDGKERVWKSAMPNTNVSFYYFGPNTNRTNIAGRRCAIINIAFKYWQTRDCYTSAKMFCERR